MPSLSRQRDASPSKVGIIGSYLPRRCGIATFSADLLTALAADAPRTEWWSVAMNDIPVGYDYPSGGAVRDRPDGCRRLPQRRRLPQHESASMRSASSTSSASMAARRAATSSAACRTCACRSSPRSTPSSRSPTRSRSEVIRAIGSLSDRIVVMSAVRRARSCARSTASRRKPDRRSFRTACPTCRSSTPRITRRSSAWSARR